MESFKTAFKRGLPNKSLDSSIHSIHSVRSNLSTNNPPCTLEGFGENLFKGAVAAPYLQRVGLPHNTLDTPDWCSNGMADKVSDPSPLGCSEENHN